MNRISTTFKQTSINELKIKITGSGSKEEIISALAGVIETLKDTTDQEIEDKDQEWEDAILFTEVCGAEGGQDSE